MLSHYVTTRFYLIGIVMGSCKQSIFTHNDQNNIRAKLLVLQQKVRFVLVGGGDPRGVKSSSACFSSLPVILVVKHGTVHALF